MMASNAISIPKKVYDSNVYDMSDMMLHVLEVASKVFMDQLHWRSPGFFRRPPTAFAGQELSADVTRQI